MCERAVEKVLLPDDATAEGRVRAKIGGTTWTTSLFPKDGRYLLPVKAAGQRAEQLDLGDVLTIRLEVDY